MITVRCSQLDRILNCSHSLLLPIENMDTVYSLEGTEQHRLASEVLKKNRIDKSLINDNTQLYINSVLENETYTIEEKYSIQYDTFILSGCPDAWSIIDKEKTLHIYDLKNGYELVTPNSYQMIGYALLMYETLKDKHSIDDIKLTIIQDEQKRELTLKPGSLFEFKDRVEKAIVSKTFKDGEHCRYCPSKAHCLIMRNTLDNINTKDRRQMIEIVKRESNLVKTIKDYKSLLLSENIQWFDRSIRRMKKWKDESKAPLRQTPIRLSPSQALKEGYDIKDNIEIEESISYKIKSTL